MNFQYEEELNRFTAACEEIMHCKFIVAEIKIMKLLKCIAETKPIYEEVARCLDGFDFNEEFKKAKVKNEDGSMELVLPIEASKKIALIFRILFAVDNKEIDLEKFINDYYIIEDEPYETYSNFCNKFIYPFMENMVCLLAGIEMIDEKPKPNFTKEINFKDRIIVDIVDILKKINKDLESKKIPDAIREEGQIVTNGFANAVITKNSESILITWVGMKNTLKEIDKMLPLLKKIEEKLTNSGLFNT